VRSGRMQSLKIDTLLSNMFDNIIRAVKTFSNKFDTTTAQLPGQLSAMAIRRVMLRNLFVVCSGSKIPYYVSPCAALRTDPQWPRGYVSQHAEISHYTVSQKRPTVDLL